MLEVFLIVSAGREGGTEGGVEIDTGLVGSLEKVVDVGLCPA